MESIISMGTYVIREVPDGLIRRAREQARANDVHLDQLLVRFLESYAQHGNASRRGGRNRMKSLTAEERSALAKAAIAKRWAGHTKKTPAAKKGL